MANYPRTTHVRVFDDDPRDRLEEFVFHQSRARWPSGHSVWPRTNVVIEGQHPENLNPALARIAADVRDVRELVETTSNQMSTWVTSFSADTYDILIPIPVVVEHYDDEVAVTWMQTNLAGYGTTSIEAFLDLEREIVSVWDELITTDESELGPHVRYILKILKQHLLANVS